MRVLSAMVLSACLLAAAIGCGPSSVGDPPLQEVEPQSAFEKAVRVVLPSLTLAEARSIDWLAESSPRQFDAILGGVHVQCTFEGKRLALGRVGIEGETLGTTLLPLLTELHGGEPTTLSDSWADPETGNSRPERKWAFPNGTDLVEHDAYQPREGEAPDRFMPSETVLRVGGS